MSRSTKTLAGGLVMIVVLFGASIRLLQAREQRYPASAETFDDALYVTSGTALRRLSAGYSSLAADVYWIRAIQYFGGTRRQLAAQRQDKIQAPAPGTAYPLLYPLLDATTTLDPMFNIAYRFGAIFLAEPYPGGAARPDLALKLLSKGLSARPDKWEYMQDMAFVHYWWRHDYKSAAEWFDRASRVPGAPWFLRSLAAVTLAEGGDRQSSRLMWESIRQSAELDWLRGEAERRLLQLRALDEIDALQKRVDAHAATAGIATSWDSIVRSGSLPGIPVDPAGIPYEINQEGRVRLARSSPLFPLPDEPKSMAVPIS